MILDQFVDCKFIIHYRIYSPQIGQKLSLKAGIKKKNFPCCIFKDYGYCIFIWSAPGGQNWKKKQWPPPLGCSEGMVQQFGPNLSF